MHQATSAVIQTLLYYAPETCAWCGGIGYVSEGLCTTCNGPGYVLASQPGLHCAGCDGSGRSFGQSDSLTGARCVICAGSGWLTRNQG